MTTQKTSHLERTAAEPRQDELNSVKVARVTQVNERIRLFRLQPLLGNLKFLPGQWVDTYVPTTPKAGGFTIASSPLAAALRTNSSAEEPYIELAVQDSPENAAAAWLWRPADQILGSEVRVRVGGSFVFPPPSHPSLTGIEKLVFVAGGVGINPMMSMLSYLAEDQTFSNLEVLVLYSSKVWGRKPEDILFASRIASLFSSGKIKGRFILYVTDVHAGWLSLEPPDYNTALGPNVEVHSGRVSTLELRETVTTDHPRSSMIYVCGPPAMTDDIFALLTSANSGMDVDPSRIMTEKWW